MEPGQVNNAIWSWHPYGPWAEWIENAPPNSRINLFDPIDRCKTCERVYKTTDEAEVKEHSHIQL